ncbi:hypothetical protein DV737_g2617, partial [Chaetothyriales sp. CBS 132003]
MYLAVGHEPKRPELYRLSPQPSEPESGYMFVEDVEAMESQRRKMHEANQAQRSGQVTLGKTLVLSMMDKPAEWDQLDEKEKFRHKKKFLIRLCGAGNVWFEEDGFPRKNQDVLAFHLNYFAAFEVMDAPEFSQAFKDTYMLTNRLCKKSSGGIAGLTTDQFDDLRVRPPPRVVNLNRDNPKSSDSNRSNSNRLDQDRSRKKQNRMNQITLGTMHDLAHRHFSRLFDTAKKADVLNSFDGDIAYTYLVNYRLQAMNEQRIEVDRIAAHLQVDLSQQLSTERLIGEQQLRDNMYSQRVSRFASSSAPFCSLLLPYGSSPLLPYSLTY